MSVLSQSLSVLRLLLAGRVRLALVESSPPVEPVAT